MSQNPINLNFPFAGFTDTDSDESLPDNVTPRAKNVQTFDVLGERARGGKRPGTRRVVANPLAGAVQRMRMVVLSSGVPLEASFSFDDPFADTGSGSTGSGVGGGWLRPQPSYVVIGATPWPAYDPVVDSETGELDDPKPAMIVENFEYSDGELETVSGGVWEHTPGALGFGDDTVTVASESIGYDVAFGGLTGAETVYRWNVPAGNVDFTKPFTIEVDFQQLVASRGSVDPSDAIAFFTFAEDFDGGTGSFSSLYSGFLQTSFATSPIPVDTAFAFFDLETTEGSDSDTYVSPDNTNISLPGTYRLRFEITPENTTGIGPDPAPALSVPGFASLSGSFPSLYLHIGAAAGDDGTSAAIRINRIRIVGEPLE